MKEKSLRQQVIEYSQSQEFSQYERYWCEKVHHFFYDGYIFWTNENWIDARLKECDYVCIYRHIIRKLETKLKYENLSDEDREYLTERLTENRHMFYKELSGMILEYCIG